MLEDGLAALGSGGRAERNIKKRLIVMYTGAAGHEESGIDMGGLFKDFWTDLSALAFDINYGLFRCAVAVWFLILLLAGDYLAVVSGALPAPR